MRFMSLAACGIAAGLLFAAPGATPGLAQDDGSEAAGDEVLAVVNGREITRAELEAAYAQLPEQYRQMPLQMLTQPLLDQLINGELLLEIADERDLDEQPDVQARLEQARANVLRQALIQDEIEKKVTEEKLREAYEARSEDPEFSTEEVKARHILLESEEAAEEVIAELDGGADFAALAEEHSTGPSASEGGDLGYFGRDAMVPPFAEAAFGLEPGTYTEDPVETQFGWHVILTEDKRTTTPSFEESEAQLRESLGREVVAALIEKAREDAEIERFIETGEGAAEGAEGEAAESEEPDQ